MRFASLTAILILALLPGCSVATPAGGAGPSAGSPAGSVPPATGPVLPSPGSQAVPTVPASCHLTRPRPAFMAPAPYPARPPALYRSSWFGGRALWTMLRPEGEIWYGLPRDKVGYSQKTFWWSAAFDVNHEQEPAISVAGQQLDGPATFTAGDPGTNASADFGTAMLVGVDIPAPGCWRITARYRGAELSYVAWVDAN